MAIPLLNNEILSESVLILAPTGQDASLIAEVLRKDKVSAAIFTDMTSLCRRAREDFGAMVLAEEALSQKGLAELRLFLSSEEPWSDAPLIVMTTGGETTFAVLRISKELSPAGNVTLLERPFRPLTLVSTVQVALRARRRQYQVRELLQKQLAATQMRDEFISVASHELKTPLTSLKLQTQLNQRLMAKNGGLPDGESISKLVDNTGRQVDRLARLVEDMLDVSRINTGKLKLQPSEVELSALVGEILERVSPQLAAAGNKLTIDIPTHVTGNWDRYRLEQVLLNLLTNSMRYAPGKDIFFKIFEDKGFAQIVLRDEGPGIAVENQERIFSRFERATTSRNIDGLGLGLYICQQIVQSHGGTIKVESKPGAGAAFFISLPIQPSY